MAGPTSAGRVTKPSAGRSASPRPPGRVVGVVADQPAAAVVVAFGIGTGDNAGMLDTLDVAQSLRDVQFPDAQAAAIARAVGQASEHGDHVTRDQFRSGISELRLEIAAVREDLRKGDRRCP